MGNGDTRKQDRTGINEVCRIVETHWSCGWQDIDASNDNGVDGIILMRRGSVETGGIVFVQVKTGTGYKLETRNRPDHIGVNVNADYIASHRPRWNVLPGPAVLIYVDPTTDKHNPNPHAWWTDLKDDSSYTEDNKSIILVPKAQRLRNHTKGDFFKLFKQRHGDKDLQLISLSRDDVSYFDLSRTAKYSAWNYYKQWKATPDSERTVNGLGAVVVSRVGWRHITRQDRKKERIIQSFHLLGAARQIIKQLDTFDRISAVKKVVTPYGTINLFDYVGMRARVQFPHRDESVVQVVLQRMREVDAHDGVITRVWFYSVYEKRRAHFE